MTRSSSQHKYVVNNKTARIINVSYGLCELSWAPAETPHTTIFGRVPRPQVSRSLWQRATRGRRLAIKEAASQGPYGAQFGLSVSGIASSPYDTAVGGTDFNWGSTASPYWNTRTTPHGATAKGYVPEVPWNDTCTDPIESQFINQALQYEFSASQICY